MSMLTLAQKRLLRELLDEIKEAADQKQAVLDRHVDDEGKASYTKLENQTNRLYAQKAALAQLLKEAGIA